jgi:hypothetical protein
MFMNGKSISIVVSKAELSLIRAVCLYEPFLIRNINRHRKEGDGCRLFFEGDDFIELLSAVSFAAEVGAPGFEPRDYKEFDQRLTRYQGLVADVYTARRKMGECLFED